MLPLIHTFLHLTPKKNEKKNIAAAAGVVTPNNFIIPVRIINFDKVGIKLYKNTVIGSVENIVDENEV